jgi:cytochrome c biogenesis protein CcmG, thiol:disulfide interchange protein DsbE
MARVGATLTALALFAVLAVPGIPTGVHAALDCGTWWVNEAQMQVGQPMPEFGFVTCDGVEMTTSGLAGRPALINFWATWCPPCVKELPHFAQLAQDNGDSVSVIGVSVDESPQTVRKFLKRKALPYTLAWDGGGIAADLGINAIPVTIALDARGRVAAVHRGYASASDLQDLLQAAQAASE